MPAVNPANKTPHPRSLAVAARHPIYAIRGEAFSSLLPVIGYGWDMEKEDEGSSYCRITDTGVAIITVDGVMVDACRDWWFDYYGYCSTCDLRDIVNNCAADANVKAILLYVNSPGGQVSGIADLADAVFAARSAKPVVAYCKDACSAAYWIASQAQRVYVAQDGYTGSIGTLLCVQDWSAFYQEMGVVVYRLTSDGAEEYKGAGTAGTEISEAQIADFKRVLNSHQSLFNAGITRGRGEFDTALADGRFYVGQEGVSLGLADGVRTFAQVAAMLDAGNIEEPDPEMPEDDCEDDEEDDGGDGEDADTRKKKCEGKSPSALAVTGAIPVSPAAQSGERIKSMNLLDEIKALFQAKGINLDGAGTPEPAAKSPESPEIAALKAQMAEKDAEIARIKQVASETIAAKKEAAKAAATRFYGQDTAKVEATHAAIDAMSEPTAIDVIASTMNDGATTAFSRGRQTAQAGLSGSDEADTDANELILAACAGNKNMAKRVAARMAEKGSV